MLPYLTHELDMLMVERESDGRTREDVPRPEVCKLPFLAAQTQTVIVFGALLARLILIDFAYLCGITKIEACFL